jgi:hypothetical protein
MTMNKLLILSVFLLVGFTPEKLIKTKAAEGIVISLPAELTPMTPEDLIQRYPSVRSPLAAYTNQERTVDFSINISATQWPDTDLPIAQSFFKSTLYNLFDRVDMINEGIHIVHKKKLVFFEFESRVNGNKMDLGDQSPVFRYSYIQYLIEPKRTLVISFNCPQREKEQWQATARAVMKTLKVK